jgi:threonine dehydrogenase-like Zn-dependent dehydrogenase
VVRRHAADCSDLLNQADFVVETEANESSLQVMLDLLRPGGAAVLKSRPAHPVPLNVTLAVKKDISLFAVSYGCFDRAIELISSGALGLTDFFGDTYSLDAFQQAFDASDDAAARKTFLHLN